MERLLRVLRQRDPDTPEKELYARIVCGQIYVNGERVRDPAAAVERGAAIEYRRRRYVSRGGDKLHAALAEWRIPVAGKVFLDAGASSGGFTDCLLQHGAARVIALDVGRGQLHWRLRQDQRVTVIEGFNARYLTPGDLPAQPEFATVDVSFISLRLILPPLAALLAPGAGLIALIKPQFEAGRGDVGHGGVVRDEAVRRRVVEEIRAFGTAKAGLLWQDCVASPLTGPKGNVEYLSWWRKGSN